MAGQGTRPGWDPRCSYWDHFWVVGHDDTYTSARVCCSTHVDCLSAGDANRSYKGSPKWFQGAGERVRFPRSTPAAIGSDVLRRGFTRDLLHESGGVSFDRFQIAVWTIVCYLHQTSIGRGWFPMSALRHGIATHRPCHRVEAGC